MFLTKNKVKIASSFCYHIKISWLFLFVRTVAFDALTSVSYGYPFSAAAPLVPNEVFVNSRIQDEYFDEMKGTLEMVNKFYIERENELSDQFSKIEGEVTILMHLRENERTKGLRSTKQKLESLKRYVAEFYLSIDHVKNFRRLNHTGFRKILKKHDKLACTTRGSEFFKGDVCKSHFWTSKIVDELNDKTETIMIDKLEDGNRSKAMNTLRVPPLESRDVRSHWATLRAGWYMGVIFVAIIVLSVALALRPDSWGLMTPVIRGLRAGFILTLWFYSFAINIVGWRLAGVNSVLIFDIELRDYRNFIQIFEVSKIHYKESFLVTFLNVPHVHYSRISVSFITLSLPLDCLSYWSDSCDWDLSVCVLCLVRLP